MCSSDLNRNQMLVAVRHGQQSPGYLAEKAFFAGLYGDHPYGSPPGGTEETLQAITREDVLNFYKRYYHLVQAGYIQLQRHVDGGLAGNRHFHGLIANQ